MNTSFAQAVHRMDRIVSKYNEEYKAGEWTTNRTLASQCEYALSAVYEIHSGECSSECDVNAHADRVRAEVIA